MSPPVKKASIQEDSPMFSYRMALFRMARSSRKDVASRFPASRHSSTNTSCASWNKQRERIDEDYGRCYVRGSDDNSERAGASFSQTHGQNLSSMQSPSREKSDNRRTQAHVGLQNLGLSKRHLSHKKGKLNRSNCCQNAPGTSRMRSPAAHQRVCDRTGTIYA
jgi:hypothetical protein